MKRLLFFSILVVLVSLLFFSCLREDIDSCEMFTERLPELEFTGVIFLCNAQPPLMDFINAKAKVTAINDDELEIRLVSDSTFIDSTLIYSFSCQVFEETIPSIGLFNENREDKGHINSGDYFLNFRFPYNQCINNTFFEGIVLE